MVDVDGAWQAALGVHLDAGRDDQVHGADPLQAGTAARRRSRHLSRANRAQQFQAAVAESNYGGAPPPCSSGVAAAPALPACERRRAAPPAPRAGELFCQTAAQGPAPLAGAAWSQAGGQAGSAWCGLTGKQWWPLVCPRGEPHAAQACSQVAPPTHSTTHLLQPQQQAAAQAHGIGHLRRLLLGAHRAGAVVGAAGKAYEGRAVGRVGAQAEAQRCQWQGEASRHAHPHLAAQQV